MDVSRWSAGDAFLSSHQFILISAVALLCSLDRPVRGCFKGVNSHCMAPTLREEQALQSPNSGETHFDAKG